MVYLQMQKDFQKILVLGISTRPFISVKFKLHGWGVLDLQNLNVDGRVIPG